MRFSIWPGYFWRWDDIVEITQHAEATGWDGVYYADHFMPNTGPDGPPSDGPALECWAALSALAASTERLRLGTLVCGNTYRHPAVLANIAAAVDQVSHGRLVLGIGAGWQVNEHTAYGIELGSVSERLDRFEEATQIILGLLRDKRTTFSGDYYNVTDAPNEPKPVQDPLPLLIGGGGERRTMRIAARYADEWNTWSTPDVMARKREVLLRHCDEVGRDPNEIKVSTQAILEMSDDPPDEPSMPFPTILGTPAQVAETVRAYEDAGVDELIIPDWNMPTLQARKDMYDRFLTEVVKR